MWSTRSFLLLGWSTVHLFSISSLAARRVSAAFPGLGRPAIFPRQAADSSDPCSTIFTPSDVYLFPAQTSYDCLGTVPFDPNVGLQLIQYYKDLLEFQSTLTYLKDPPPSYQQPGTDLLASLADITDSIIAGTYENEYEFEAALQAVIYSAHDSHLNLDAGVTSIFRFGAPYGLVSLSTDGLKTPKVYIYQDLIRMQSDPSFEASAILSINDEIASQWLTEFATLNAFGLLEANADWNALMNSPAAAIQGRPSAFTGASPFYPGNMLNVVFEDGHTRSDQWLSLANVPSDAPPINNGMDIYQYFVLFQTPTSDTSSISSDTLPVSTQADTPSSISTDTVSPTITDTSSSDDPTPSASSSDTQSQATPTGWPNPAYPSTADVVQPDLGLGGYLTGYFLRDSSTAVLSIPSFEMTGSAIVSFSNTIGEFLTTSKALGMTKVVVDLQQNRGGEILLAVDAFRQFFPSIDPFGGSRIRSSNFSDALGDTFTQYYQQYLATLSEQNSSYSNVLLDIPWAVLDYIDASTAQNFSSWPEFFGPHPDHGDSFSTVQRNNLSSILFDEVASGGFQDDGYTPAGIVVYGYGNRTTKAPSPFAAEDIILLTDGHCHSSCAVFAEMMHHEAGVRTVVVGGGPNIGPMQAVAGSRGAFSYDAATLDNDLKFAVSVNQTVTASLPTSHTSSDLKLWISYAQFNLRDQIRKAEYIPLQFAYEAANCRIFWTLSTFNNFTALWEHAANAIWQDSSLCVEDSTIFPSPANGSSDIRGPGHGQKVSWTSEDFPLLLSTSLNPSSIATPRSVVQEISDGQLQVSATPTSKVNPRHLYEGQPSALATSVPILLGRPEKFAEKRSLPFNAGIANDDYQRLIPTLNRICNGPQDCNRKQDERCLYAPMCKNGVWNNHYRCKKACSLSKTCSPSLNTFCNLDDLACSYSTKSKNYVCNKTTLQDVPGSGDYTNTAQNKHTVVYHAGYCEPILVGQGRCIRAEGELSPPPEALSDILLHPIPTLVVDMPTSRNQISKDNNPQGVPLKAAEKASADKSTGDYIVNMWARS